MCVVVPLLGWLGRGSRGGISVIGAGALSQKIHHSGSDIGK
jgi:hypothetical protein